MGGEHEDANPRRRVDQLFRPHMGDDAQVVVGAGELSVGEARGDVREGPDRSGHADAEVGADVGAGEGRGAVGDDARTPSVGSSTDLEREAPMPVQAP
jgi:hypothetical protein